MISGYTEAENNIHNFIVDGVFQIFYLFHNCSSSRQRVHLNEKFFDIFCSFIFAVEENLIYFCLIVIVDFQKKQQNIHLICLFPSERYINPFEVMIDFVFYAKIESLRRNLFKFSKYDTPNRKKNIENYSPTHKIIMRLRFTMHKIYSFLTWPLVDKNLNIHSLLHEHLCVRFAIFI